MQVTWLSHRALQKFGPLYKLCIHKYAKTNKFFPAYM